MQKVFNVAVDIGRKLPAPAFEVNTNDLKSVKLLITITNGQTLLDLTDMTVRIAIRKPDNNILFQDCTIKDAKTGQVEIVLENQAYIMAGTHTAEIMCYKGSDVVAVSGTFSYKSTKGIMNDEAVESKSEFTTITGMLKDVQDTIEDFRENGTGIDTKARQDIQSVTTQLAEMPKTVNGKSPDEDGNIEVEVDVDTTNLATKDDFNQTARLAPGKKGILYAGVIRNDGSGWKYITDEVHNNINFSSIDVTQNHEIVVYFAKGKKIGSMLVTPDETLASYGLTCGASVGDTASFIKCYAPFTGYIDGGGNLIINDWFKDAFTVTPIGDGTGFTVNYDGGGNGKEKVLATNVRDGTAPHNGLDIRAARGGAGQAVLRSYHDLYGVVAYDGSAFGVTSSCVAGITTAFDNATGVLTITHDSMAGGTGYNEFQSVSITPRKSASGGLIHPRIHSVTQSQIKVEFYDQAGTLITIPNTNMRIYFSRPGFRVPHTWNAGAKAYFDFGYALVRPSKLISPNGNLWLLGLHESV